MANLHYCILLGLASFVLADITRDIKTDLVNSAFIRLFGRDGNHTDEYLGNAINLLSKMNKCRNVTFYIPGYLESVDDSTSVPAITNAYLNSTDHNVMALDYRLIEKNLYPVGVDLTDEVGKAVAAALDKFVDAGISIEKWNVIGFSLGAQVAGAVGRSMKNTLPIITGLDPAGPFFTFIQQHLQSTDAKFVMVIHGDMGVYGTPLKLGDVDFYPNFGRKPQPGCPLLDPPLFKGDTCSHTKTTLIYAATVQYPELFVASNCNNALEFISGRCTNRTVLMGYGTPRNTTGNYYLLTNEEYPYGRGIEGAYYS